MQPISVSIVKSMYVLFFDSDSENSSSYEYDDIKNNIRFENTEEFESDDELNTSLMKSLMLYDVHNLNNSIDNTKNTTYLKEWSHPYMLHRINWVYMFFTTDLSWRLSSVTKRTSDMLMF